MKVPVLLPLSLAKNLPSWGSAGILGKKSTRGMINERTRSIKLHAIHHEVAQEQEDRRLKGNLHTGTKNSKSGQSSIGLRTLHVLLVNWHDGRTSAVPAAPSSCQLSSSSGQPAKPLDRQEEEEEVINDKLNYDGAANAAQVQTVDGLPAATASSASLNGSPRLGTRLNKFVVRSQ